MNNKSLGERGERIAIGELAKFGIDVLLPMSDNLPYDFVVDYKGHLYKCQVKTASVLGGHSGFEFTLTTSNWNKHETLKYNDGDYDVLICCDLNDIYLFRYDEVRGRSALTIRTIPPKRNQTKGINLAKDFIISSKRIDEVFT